MKLLFHIRTKFYPVLVTILCCFGSCQTPDTQVASARINHFTWDNATVYFLMTDRFYNADLTNDYAHTADNAPAPYRGFMGGDLKGITAKINEGYFSKLGVNAIWMTPVVENILGSVDEGTGNSFGFHGYWTRDWTSIDPRIGTEEDLKELVKTAHDHGIRILLDVVANHTGPVTELDPKWPEDWVKTGPRCIYQDAKTTIDCTLVENLPDIRTESDEEVELPPFLIEKWTKEGRLDREIQELETWFVETGYPRTPVNYILKWLVDLIKKYGVDGFRVDTVKHTEEYVWRNLWQAASVAFEDYKRQNPASFSDDQAFYMVGEVYNYYIHNGREYDYGDRKVDFFDAGFKSLINFDFKSDAERDVAFIFNKYDSLLHGSLQGKTVLNYISSHDDGGPFDKERQRSKEAATKLLLCPGGVQIYYGDESVRSLSVSAEGDATLRSFMNWEDLEAKEDILTHWQKIGQFRRDNPAVGAGRHRVLNSEPFIFERRYEQASYTNKVVVALGTSVAGQEIDVSSSFAEGTCLTDAYSGLKAQVKNGKVKYDSSADILLLELCM